MGRFDIYSNPGRNKASIPYLPPDLFPIISVEGSDYFLDTPQLGAIPVQELKAKVGSAQAHQFEIQMALDRVFGAY